MCSSWSQRGKLDPILPEKWMSPKRKHTTAVKFPAPKYITLKRKRCESLSRGGWCQGATPRSESYLTAFLWWKFLSDGRKATAFSKYTFCSTRIKILKYVVAESSRLKWIWTIPTQLNRKQYTGIEEVQLNSMQSSWTPRTNESLIK